MEKIKFSHSIFNVLIKIAQFGEIESRAYLQKKTTKST